MQLASIQFLRFVAALAVVLFHAEAIGANYFGPGTGLLDVLHLGDRGVDLFFVISGFIICYAFAGRQMSPGAFIWRRAIRIVPVYWFYTLAIAVLLVLLPSAFSSVEPFSAPYLLKSLTFTSFTDGRMPLLYLGWTLEYEAFFYVLVAVVLALAGERWQLIAAGLAALTLVGRVVPAEVGPVVGFFANPMLLEFALGVLVACQVRRLGIGWIAPLAICAAYAALAMTDPLHRAIVAGIPSALLVWVGAAWLDRREWPRWLGVPLLLGGASYSIYLVQAFTLPMIYKTMRGVLPGVPLEVAVVVATIGTLAAGVVSYFLIERPSLAFLKTWGAKRALDPA